MSGHDNVMDEIQRLAMADNFTEQIAKHMYSIYRAYVKAGFIETQAFELTKITLKSFVMVEV